MRQNYEPKPLFIKRMKKLLGEANNERYWKKVSEDSVRSIRVNTLKISPSNLKKRLEEKGWKITQPFKENQEIMFIESNLEPGELGRSFEHLLGYYYIQETASMLPAIALNPKPEDLVLDLCAAPGSKTTQIAAMMKNKGTIIANDPAMGRIKILASNLERCGASNAIITKKEGIILCKKLKENGFIFDKILVDAPCSGEGNIWSVKKTLLMWNINNVKSLSKIQKKLLSSAIEILKVGGEIVYSTCTHAPEENEGVLDFALKEFGERIKIEKISLPIKCSLGIDFWEENKYEKDVVKSCRVYPHIANTEGFFVAKIRRTR